MKLANGDYYKGEFRDDLYHGKGSFIDAETGDKYEGDFENGSIHFLCNIKVNEAEPEFIHMQMGINTKANSLQGKSMDKANLLAPMVLSLMREDIFMFVFIFLLTS